ncbi:hypothetical protein Droror1_Dr00023092 [Drosera rotundifolia]
MEKMELNEDDQSMEETLSRELTSLESPDADDIFGEPLVHPRIGDEYQAEIHPMLNESERLQLLMDPAEARMSTDVSHSFAMGLPVPITWIYNDVKPIKEELTASVNKLANAADSNGFVNSEKEVTESLISLNKDQDSKVDASVHKCRNIGYSHVPCLPSESWSDFEVDCFLLGLYIFGKNLLQVKNFMESKDIGQVLSFYYGRFYRSPRYCKWLDCRKMRKRKCIVGERLFTGGRQQELFCRLLPHISEDSKSSLQEVFKAFAEGRTSMEEYVSTLKAMVGLCTLIEAVGIGKGKDDLTTLVEASKATRGPTFCPELPSGSACSSLTCAEIIKFLTGGFRLSKARSNDLFWEAVWPCLLAKGWQSEQPKNEGYKCSKNNLVFLVPGVKKFSRRKLVKGNHYFDSVSDVLNKIASKPELLELEAGEARDGSSKAENGWVVSSDSDSGSDQKPRRFLKARIPANNSLPIKFTLVDTSLAEGENPSKIRELRSLPFQAKSIPVLKSRSRKINGISPRESAEEPLMVDARLSGGKNHACENHAADLKNGAFENQMVAKNTPGSSNGLVERLADHETNISVDKQSRTIKHQFSRRPKHDRPSLTDPTLKRQKLLACNVSNAIPSVGESCSVLSSPAQERDVAPASYLSAAQLSSIDSVAAGNLLEKAPACPTLDALLDEKEKPDAEESFDFNELKLAVVELESGFQIKVEPRGEHCSHDPPVKSESVGLAEEKLVISGRRQSTRNRPLTKKALEALATGMLSPKQTRKRRQTWSEEDIKPTLSTRHRRRRRKAAPRNCPVGVVSSSGSARYDTVSDGMAQPVVEKPSPAAETHVRASETANIQEGTDFECNGYDGVRFSLARILSHKSSPSIRIHLREMMSTNGSVGEDTLSKASEYDRSQVNVVSENLNLKPRPAGDFPTRKTENSDSCVTEVTKPRNREYIWVPNSLGLTLNQKLRPCRHLESHARNDMAEASRSNIDEGSVSMSSRNARVFSSLAHAPEKNSRPLGRPRMIRVTALSSDSVGGDTEPKGSVHPGHGSTIMPLTPLVESRQSASPHVRSSIAVAVGPESVGSGDARGGSASTPQALGQKMGPSGETLVGNNELGNDIGEIPASGGSEQDKEPMPASQSVIRITNPATTSAGQGIVGSGLLKSSTSMKDNPKQKPRPSGRSRAKNTEFANGNSGERIEASGVGSNRVSNGTVLPVNNPLFQANQQVARELWGFSRSSSFSKP